MPLRKRSNVSESALKLELVGERFHEQVIFCAGTVYKGRRPQWKATIAYIGSNGRPWYHRVEFSPGGMAGTFQTREVITDSIAVTCSRNMSE